MRFASYVKDGRPAWGVVVGDGGLVTVTGELAERCPTLRSAIAGGALVDIGKALAPRTPDAKVEAVEMLPVIPNPDKILCIGLNYEDHRLEGGHAKVDNPTIFVRFPGSQMGHGQPMVKPTVSERLDYEAEIAVVIGRGGRHIADSEAMAHVAGYSCYNDGSVRDWQRHTTQFTPGKNFHATGGFGPWLVSADEIPDPGVMTVECRLNGEVMQHASVKDMIFPIPRLIAYISTFIPLLPGDVIATGTPGGVGSRRDPQVWMKPGDVVEIEVGGVGVLRNPVVAE